MQSVDIMEENSINDKKVLESAQNVAEALRKQDMFYVIPLLDLEREKPFEPNASLFRSIAGIDTAASILRVSKQFLRRITRKIPLISIEGKGIVSIPYSILRECIPKDILSLNLYGCWHDSRDLVIQKNKSDAGNCKVLRRLSGLKTRYVYVPGHLNAKGTYTWRIKQKWNGETAVISLEKPAFDFWIVKRERAVLVDVEMTKERYTVRNGVSNPVLVISNGNLGVLFRRNDENGKCVVKLRGLCFGSRKTESVKTKAIAYQCRRNDDSLLLVTLQSIPSAHFQKLALIGGDVYG